MSIESNDDVLKKAQNAINDSFRKVKLQKKNIKTWIVPYELGALCAPESISPKVLRLVWSG